MELEVYNDKTTPIYLEIHVKDLIDENAKWALYYRIPDLGPSDTVRTEQGNIYIPPWTRVSLWVPPSALFPVGYEYKFNNLEEFRRNPQGQPQPPPFQRISVAHPPPYKKVTVSGIYQQPWSPKYTPEWAQYVPDWTQEFRQWMTWR